MKEVVHRCCFGVGKGARFLSEEMQLGKELVGESVYFSLVKCHVLLAALRYLSVDAVINQQVSKSDCSLTVSYI